MTETKRKPYRPTPTGVLVTSAAPGSDEWFEARRGGITGTDLPKILGDSDDSPDPSKRYGNSLSVWLDKRGELPDEGVGEAGEWGTILEDPVARVWAARNGVTVRRVGVIAHKEHPERRASLDRLVSGCKSGKRCGLEVKTRSAYKAGSFREDIPDDVLSQVAWGRLVSGLDHMHVAVLIGGQRLAEFTYERDDVLENFLIESIQPVWKAVLEGVPPHVEPDSDGVLLALLNRMYGAREGDREVDAQKAAKWLSEYERGSVIEKDGKGVKEKAKTALVEMLDDGDTALVGGAPAYTYKRPNPSSGMPAKEVSRLRKEQPETFARLEEDGFIVTSHAGPRFSAK